MKSGVTPTPGRIVLYVPKPGSLESFMNPPVLPALIVRVREEEEKKENSEVGLTVFLDGSGTSWIPDAPHSTNKEPGTWHWPEIKK